LRCGKGVERQARHLRRRFACQPVRRVHDGVRRHSRHGDGLFRLLLESCRRDERHGGQIVEVTDFFMKVFDKNGTVLCNGGIGLSAFFGLVLQP